MSYKVFGWLNVFLLGIQLLPYLLVLLNKHVFHTKNETYRTIIKGLRKYHKHTAVLFVISSLIHGYMALFGVIRLHTGTILFASIVLTVIVGYGFYKRKKKELLNVHKVMALVVVALFLVHFFVPNFVFYLQRALNP
ncbi:MAG: hypothetical protein WAV55_04185 [Clostridiaceae bacterium]